MARERILISWSSGKDSAWALHQLRRGAEYEIVGLLTTINSNAARVAMHAVRTALLEAQAAAVGLSLWKVPIPYGCTNQQYEAAMSAATTRARAEGISAIAFGDLFLTDVRRYREEQLADTGIRPLFPLWGQATSVLAGEMVAAGLRAVLTCVDPKQLPARFAGRAFDRQFLADLPVGVDPCGENGEFHSFVHAGPMFESSLSIGVGEVVERDGFVFADVEARDAEG